MSLPAYVPGFSYGKYLGLSHRARLALERGSFNQAELHARRLLKIARGYRGDRNYGNAVHHGNLVLGRIALRNGDVAQARNYLLKSADIEGSPQLDAFGPNMRLALELLNANEADAVLLYLERCKGFWEMGEESIEYWQAQIRNGMIPNFGRNLYY